MSVQTKQPDEPSTPAPSADRPSMTPRLSVRNGVLLIAGLALLVYLPALQGDFIMDDNLLLTDNNLVQASDGFYQFWRTSQQVEYYPVSYTTLWLEWRLWGRHPTGYRITNLVLHIAAALLVWAILRRLSIPGAFLAALLFAVHPVNVESVAWIAQRRNVLAMVFFLLSILGYLKADELSPSTDKDLAEESQPPPHQSGAGAEKWYWLSLLAFVLAMLSKGSVAILPLVLLLIAWWQRGRITMADFKTTLPFFLVAVALTAVHIWFQTHGADIVFREASFAQRLAGAGAAVWFYLLKALLPIHLMFVYPHWHIQTSDWRWWLPILAAMGVTAVLLWQHNSPQANWGRAMLFAWGFFCVALVPVLGFTDVGFMRYSLVADHYQHIAIIGVVALVAAAWSEWYAGAARKIRVIARAGALLLVGVLTFLTYQQSRLYADAITLYQATLEKNPDCWVVHYNLGIQLFDRGLIVNALKHYREAVRLKPDYAEAHNNLGLALCAIGRFQPAIEHFQEALRLKPDFIEARNNLGIALGSLGRMDEAIACFQESLRIQPRRAATHYNLGRALAQLNRLDEAIEHYQQAVELKPDYAEAWANLAATYGDLNRWEEAMGAANTALKFAQAQGLTAVAEKIMAWQAMQQPGSK